MNEVQPSVAQGHPARKLGPEEIALLQKREGSTKVLSRVVLVTSVVVSVIALIYLAISQRYTISITLIVLMIFLATPFYILMKNESKRQDALNASDLEVYKIEGVLNIQLQDVISGRGAAGRIYIATIDEFKLPEFVWQSGAFRPQEVLKPYIGQKMTAEYVPAISRNCRIYSVDGKGYDFLTQRPLG